jgi:nucleoside-diphosphate-sugar epimerase
MTTKHKHDNPILVTGAAGAVGGIGRNLTEFLLARGHKVRALTGEAPTNMRDFVKLHATEFNQRGRTHS